MTGDEIRSSAPSMMFYQKALTGVLLGAVFHRLTCRVHWLLFANVNN